MTSPTEPKNPVDAETTAGNYFVSNYPPYSYWKPEGKPDFFKALEQPPADANPLGLYVHIPFCRKRCHFCYFRVYTGVKSDEIRAYVDAALQELALYKNKPFLGGRKPRFVYFGGGTPSFLSTAQLQLLADGIQEALPWDEAEEVAFECEPGTLNEKKLQFIKDLGVTRLSLGIENFNADILEVNGRAHRADEVYRAFENARKADFPQINIDLIAGMMNETEDNWQDNIQRAIALDPDSITIYQMEIPFNTTIYRQMKEAGKVVAPVADWETKRRWVKYAFGELEKAGYEIGSAYTAVKKDRNVKFVYRDALWQGADMLALGVASFGHINGVHYQNEHNMDTYLAQIEKQDFPVYRALTPSSEERLIREFVLQFKLGQIDPSYFQDKFGVDVVRHFEKPLAQLGASGFLEPDKPLHLTRDGLLEVDRLLHEFFLPQHLGPEIHVMKDPSASIPLLHPLELFYPGEESALPAAEALAPDEVPEVYRKLLVHVNDMTPTLESFYHDRIHLKRLKTIHEGMQYAREVILLLDRDDRPVEYGANRVHLDNFPENCRQPIVEGYIPLGTIMGEYLPGHYSQPAGFFRAAGNNNMAEAFGQNPLPALYGRRNVIYRADGAMLSEVVEILAPVED